MTQGATVGWTKQKLLVLVIAQVAGALLYSYL